MAQFDFSLSVFKEQAILRGMRGVMSEYPFAWTPNDNRAYQDYWERLARMAVALNPQNVLLIGGCLGVIPMMMRKLGSHALIVALEPDPRIAAIGKAFGLGKPMTDWVHVMTLDKWAANMRKDKEYYFEGAPPLTKKMHFDLAIVDAYDDNGAVYQKEEFLGDFGSLFTHVLANPAPGGRSEQWK
jgi:hypothetical protein